MKIQDFLLLLWVLKINLRSLPLVLLSRLCISAGMSWWMSIAGISHCSILVLIRADEDDIVPYQSFCDPTVNSGECSDNFNCRCLSIAPTGERICILQVQCRFTPPCNATHQCTSPGTICVRDHRCAGEFFCYPTSFTNPDLCPPLATGDTMFHTDWSIEENIWPGWKLVFSAIHELDCHRLMAS